MLLNIYAHADLFNDNKLKCNTDTIFHSTNHHKETHMPKLTCTITTVVTCMQLQEGMRDIIVVYVYVHAEVVYMYVIHTFVHAQ